MKGQSIHRDMIDLGDLKIFCRDTKTEGPAILCLHGRWGRGETWVDFIRRYGARYRILAPDQRGHGLSDRPLGQYTGNEMARDMVGLLDRLGIESAIVVGHSMGGCVAGHLAALHPERVRALAILDKSAAGPKTRSALPLAELPLVDPVTKEWQLPFASLLEAEECIKAAMDSELSYRYFMNSLVETVEGYTMMFSEAAIAANIAYYRDWFELLPKIACPVLLLRAKGGEAVPDEDFARMKAALAHCLAFEISDPDHNVHLANKKEFYGIFDEFLEEVEGV